MMVQSFPWLICTPPPSPSPGRSNPLRIFAAHEVAAFCDPSMATKMTVQFNLFGGTVLKLVRGRRGVEREISTVC